MYMHHNKVTTYKFADEQNALQYDVCKYICCSEYTCRPALQTELENQFWLEMERLLIIYKKRPVLIWMVRLITVRRKKLMT